MTTASEKMIQAIEYVVKPISIGTNVALLHLLWAMVSGAFLSSRGAVHTALKLSGRSDAETRRGGNALRKGQWQISELISRWREWVMKEGGWEVKEYEGWRAVSCDAVVFPRLKLKGWKAKLYRGTFGRAIKAVGLGVIVDVGHYGMERVPLLRKIIRCQNTEEGENELKKELLKEGARTLKENEVLVHDAGTSVKDVQEAGVPRYVIRLAKNCVARWNYLPEDAHGNRQYGERIRPLARSRKGKKIESTSNPTIQTSFEYQGRTIKAWCWQNVVGQKDKVSDKAQTYHLWVFLTRCIQIRLSWLPISMPKPKRYSVCTVTAGLWNKFLWPPNRWLDCIANLSSTQYAVGDCLSWRYWLATS